MNEGAPDKEVVADISAENMALVSLFVESNWTAEGTW